MTQQATADKQTHYFGSQRMFYSGVSLTSGTAYAFVDYSGASSGFGAAQDVLSQRFSIVGSGTSQVQWSWFSGTTPYVNGEIYGNQAIVLDGVSRSGVWVRSEKVSKVQIFAW